MPVEQSRQPEIALLQPIPVQEGGSTVEDHNEEHGNAAKDRFNNDPQEEINRDEKNSEKEKLTHTNVWSFCLGYISDHYLTQHFILSIFIP